MSESDSCPAADQQQMSPHTGMLVGMGTGDTDRAAVRNIRCPMTSETLRLVLNYRPTEPSLFLSPEPGADVPGTWLPSSHRS